MRILSLFGICAAIALAGCNSTKTDVSNPSAENPTPPNGAMDLAIVFDKGGVGDKSFNDSAERGRARAEKELGLGTKTVASRTDLDYSTNLENLSKLNYKLIVAVGGGMQKALETVAPKFPNTMFAIIDGESKADNVVGIRFREEEGSFLAGVLAGRMTKTNKLGFVGGKKIPLIEKFEYGFRAGVHAVNPHAVVIAKYTEDWDNVAKGKDAALACHAEGADVVYHAAGRCGLGVFDAAEEGKFYAIGVDSNQDDLKPGIILTSVVKGVDEQVFRMSQEMKEGKLKAGNVTVGVKEGGVGLTDMKNTRDKIGAETLTEIDKYKKEIADGKITVPKTKAEYDALVAKG